MPRAIVDIQNVGADAAEVLAHIGTSSFRDAYAAHSDPDDLEAHVKEFFSVQAVRACIETRQSSYVLASVDGQPGAFAKYRIAPCPVPAGALHALELQQLYVLASHQRHGLGARLVQFLSKIAVRQQLQGIWLSCWEDADWALSFYLKNGFSRVGTADFAVGSTTYCDYLLWLALEPECRKSASHSHT
ncbi:MAG: GNAT family N-acetyltransferase [Gammaproteobacteria bacterium]|nr:GNAT family N-acetyltransferase [Gammaproteobacteria bacterium]MDH5305157.1 GNAT family N-acetyltransferase [Gammaproteobacteria bacterium]MDH5323235.1 GNAT family N-acetyltransferase [Gammaproteobacteria bacterium]